MGGLSCTHRVSRGGGGRGYVLRHIHYNGMSLPLNNVTGLFWGSSFAIFLSGVSWFCQSLSVWCYLLFFTDLFIYVAAKTSFVGLARYLVSLEAYWWDIKFNCCFTYLSILFLLYLKCPSRRLVTVCFCLCRLKVSSRPFDPLKGLCYGNFVGCCSKLSRYLFKRDIALRPQGGKYYLVFPKEEWSLISF